MTQVGRGVWFKKYRVDHCRRLDMAILAREVDLETRNSTVLTWTSYGKEESSIGIDIYPGEELEFHYTFTDYITGKSRPIGYRVRIELTSCHFGGKRWWFLCPDCDRRCRILYLAPRNNYFACRECRNLTYKSQQEGKRIFAMVLDAIYSYETLFQSYYRTRSPQKKAKLLRKIRNMETMLSMFVGRYGNKQY